MKITIKQIDKVPIGRLKSNLANAEFSFLKYDNVQKKYLVSKNPAREFGLGYNFESNKVADLNDTNLLSGFYEIDQNTLNKTNNLVYGILCVYSLGEKIIQAIYGWEQDGLNLVLKQSIRNYDINSTSWTSWQYFSNDNDLLTNIYAQLSNKVDKESGKGLSQNDFTDSLKLKLESLDDNKFAGVFTSKTSLDAVTGVIGGYAYVNTPGTDVVMYIWDDDDNIWIETSGSGGVETPATIKVKYESNPDTNAFTDADKTKLQGLNNYDDTDLVNDITELQNDKVDKITGKGLSENDFTTALKNKVDLIINNGTGDNYLADDGTYKPVSGGGTQADWNATSGPAEILNKPDLGQYATTTQLGNLSTTVDNKVDKVTGMGLSKNDFTDPLKTKLENLAPYLNWKGYVDVYGDLPSSGAANDAYFNVDDKKLYVYNGTNFPPNGSGIPLTDLFDDLFEVKDMGIKTINRNVDGTNTYYYLANQKTIASVVKNKDWTTVRKIGFWVGFDTLTTGTAEVYFRIYTTTTTNNISVVARTLKAVTIPTFSIKGLHTYYEIDLESTFTNAGDEFLCLMVSSPLSPRLLLTYSATLLANNIQMPQNKVNTTYMAEPTNQLLINIGTNSRDSYALAYIQEDINYKSVLVDTSLDSNIIDYNGTTIYTNMVAPIGSKYNSFATFKALGLPILTSLKDAKKITLYIRLDGQVTGQPITLSWGVFGYYKTSNTQNPYGSDSKSWIKRSTIEFKKNAQYGDFTPLELDLSDVTIMDDQVAIYISCVNTISYLTSGSNKKYDTVNYPSIGFTNFYGGIDLNLVTQNNYIDNSEALYEIHYNNINKRAFTTTAIDTIKNLSKTKTNNIEFILPRQIPVVINTEVNFYFDSLISKVKDPNIIVSGNNLVPRHNRVFYAPSSVNTAYTIQFLDVARDISHKLNLLTLARTGGSGNKYGTVISDSLENQDPRSKYIQDKLTADYGIGGANLTLVGSQTTGGGNHEGNPSWKWEDFLTKATFAGRTNPFWDGTRVNVPYYCTNRGIPQLDYVIIALGTNDVLQGNTYYDTETQKEALINSIMVYAKGFINALLDPVYGNPNMKIGVNLAQYGSSGYQRENFKQLCMMLNKKYIEEFDWNPQNPNVFINCTSCIIDRKLAYPTINLSAGSAYTPTVYPEQNEVHPISQSSGGGGYKQIAEQNYNMFRFLLTL